MPWRAVNRLKTAPGGTTSFSFGTKCSASCEKRHDSDGTWGGVFGMGTQRYFDQTHSLQWVLITAQESVHVRVWVIVRVWIINGMKEGLPVKLTHIGQRLWLPRFTTSHHDHRWTHPILVRTRGQRWNNNESSWTQMREQVAGILAVLCTHLQTPSECQRRWTESHLGFFRPTMLRPRQLP